MTLTRPQVRQALFLRIDGLGGSRNAVTRDADGLIDPMMFRQSAAGRGDFKGSIIYSPNGGVTELIRTAGLISANKLLQTGDAWTMTDTYYELHYLLHPFAMNECIRQAPHLIYGEEEVPLTIWEDGDFSSTSVAAWSNGTVTPTKSTLYKLINNQRSLVVAAAAGNLYAQSEYAPVSPKDQLFHSAIGALDIASSGDAYYAIVNGSDSDAVLYEKTFSSYKDQIVINTLDIPANCKKIALRLGATANGVTTIWKAAPSHIVGEATSKAQSWLKEQMNLLGFSYATYGRSTGTDLYNAEDRSLQALAMGREFELKPFVPASSHYTLEMRGGRKLEANDYWIHGYRKMSDIQEEMDNENASTDIDEDMFLTACEYLVCRQLGPAYAQQTADAKDTLDSQRIARPVVQEQPETGIFHVGLRGRRNY